MNKSERCDRLDNFVRDGRIIRRDWSIGTNRACLLAAYSPEVYAAKTASACPADSLWPWLATMVPSIDDNGSMAAWPAMVQRFASVMRLIAALPAERWNEVGRRCETRVKIIAIDEAARHVSAPVIGVVRSLLMRRLDGDEPTKDEWAMAYTKAEAASAARAAAAAAEVAEEAAARVAAWAAAEAAWDRMTDAILTAIEEECS